MGTIANWGVFILLGVIAYTLISYFGMVTSTAPASSPLSVVKSIFTHPAGLIAMIVGNLLFAVAMYFGVTLTPFALSIMYATGAMTGFAYTWMTDRPDINSVQLLGIALIIGGILLLSSGETNSA